MGLQSQARKEVGLDQPDPSLCSNFKHFVSRCGAGVAWQSGTCSFGLNLLMKYGLSKSSLKAAVLPGKLFCY